MSIEEMLWSTDPQIIVGLLGTGFILAWISELIFSVIGLFSQFIIKKIKYKFNKEE